MEEERVRTRGVSYLILPTQTMHYYGQITQNYHTLVLFDSDSPNMGNLMTPEVFKGRNKKHPTSFLRRPVTSFICSPVTSLFFNRSEPGDEMHKSMGHLLGNPYKWPYTSITGGYDPTYRGSNSTYNW